MKGSPGTGRTCSQKCLCVRRPVLSTSVDPFEYQMRSSGLALTAFSTLGTQCVGLLAKKGCSTNAEPLQIHLINHRTKSFPSSPMSVPYPIRGRLSSSYVVASKFQQSFRGNFLDTTMWTGPAHSAGDPLLTSLSLSPSVGSCLLLEGDGEGFVLARRQAVTLRSSPPFTAA